MYIKTMMSLDIVQHDVLYIFNGKVGDEIRIPYDPAMRGRR